MFKELIVLTVFIAVGWGQCPDGHQVGDTWQKPNECVQCFCGSKGAICRECPSKVLVQPDNEKCYSEFDNSLPFSKCCRPVIICEGDASFNANKLPNRE